MGQENDEHSTELLLEKINDQVRQDLRDNQADIEIQAEDFNSIERREKNIGEIRSRLGDLLGEDINKFDIDPSEYVSVRKKHVEELRDREQAAIERRQSIRRRLRSSIEHLSRAYNRKSPNPGETVCLTEARGHQSEEIVFGGQSTGSSHSTAAFAVRGPGDNALDLRVLTTGRYGVRRSDWLHFLWDGPDDAGITNVSATMTLAGGILVISAPAVWFDISFARFRLDAFMRVTQELEQGDIVPFGERVFPLIPPTLLDGGETFYRTVATEETFAYTPQMPLPILAGQRVVVTVGVRWNLQSLGIDNVSDIDLSSGLREVNFPFVLLKHET